MAESQYLLENLNGPEPVYATSQGSITFDPLMADRFYSVEAAEAFRSGNNLDEHTWQIAKFDFSEDVVPTEDPVEPLTGPGLPELAGESVAEPELEKITDFMVDLETLGTGTDAVIVGIGVAGFNMATGKITPCLDLTVSADSCLDRGLTVAGDTIMWWLQQSDAARAKLLVNRQTLQEALFEVMDVMRSAEVAEDVKVWGNGATFDCTILRSAFEACGMKTPWGFWNDRDVRTLRDVALELGCEDFKKTLEFEGVAHQALDDAVHQAKYTISYFNFLRENAAAAAAFDTVSDRDKEPNDEEGTEV